MLFAVSRLANVTVFFAMCEEGALGEKGEIAGRGDVGSNERTSVASIRVKGKDFGWRKCGFFHRITDIF